MPLVVHYWADLQSVHGLRCYGNITRTRNISEYMLILALYLVLRLHRSSTNSIHTPVHLSMLNSNNIELMYKTATAGKYHFSASFKLGSAVRITYCTHVRKRCNSVLALTLPLMLTDFNVFTNTLCVIMAPYVCKMSI